MIEGEYVPDKNMQPVRAISIDGGKWQPLGITFFRFECQLKNFDESKGTELGLMEFLHEKGFKIAK